MTWFKMFSYFLVWNEVGAFLNFAFHQTFNWTFLLCTGFIVVLLDIAFLRFDLTFYHSNWNHINAQKQSTAQLGLPGPGHRYSRHFIPFYTFEVKSNTFLYTVMLNSIDQISGCPGQFWANSGPIPGQFRTNSGPIPDTWQPYVELT